MVFCEGVEPCGELLLNRLQVLLLVLQPLLIREVAEVLQPLLIVEVAEALQTASRQMRSAEL